MWTRANRWKTITPNTKRENGLYPPTQQAFGPSPFRANVLARWLGSRVRDGRGVVVSVRGGTPKPCKHHHAHNPVDSSGSACHVVSTLHRGASSWAGLCPVGGRSAPVRPKDRGLNGIKTPERTRPTSAPGYMPRHPTPRTLKPLAVREVDSGVNLRYPPPCSGGDFCNRGARHACTYSFPSPAASPSLLPSPDNNICILVRVFFLWHAHESGPPRWARMSTVWVRFCFCR